jgi:hypothetical protein
VVRKDVMLFETKIEPIRADINEKLKDLCPENAI